MDRQSQRFGVAFGKSFWQADDRGRWNLRQRLEYRGNLQSFAAENAAYNVQALEPRDG